MPLIIPEQHKQGLADLVKLPKATADSLQRAISAAKPGFATATLAAQLESVGIPVDTLRAILVVLSSLAITAYDRQMSADELARDVVTRAAEERIGGLEPGSSEADELQRRLVAFLTSPTLQVTAKASYVMTQHQAAYSSARVLTDLRPIHSTESPPVLAAAVIVHVLQLTTMQDGDEHSLFVALDANDLVKLRATLDRAVAKEAVLRDALASTTLSILQLPSDK